MGALSSKFAKMSAAVAPSQIAALPIVNENTSQPHDVLDMHKDRISAAELDLSDAYGMDTVFLPVFRLTRNFVSSCIFARPLRDP